RRRALLHGDRGDARGHARHGEVADLQGARGSSARAAAGRARRRRAGCRPRQADLSLGAGRGTVSRAIRLWTGEPPERISDATLPARRSRGDASPDRHRGRPRPATGAPAGQGWTAAAPTAAAATRTRTATRPGPRCVERVSRMGVDEWRLRVAALR